MGHAQAPPRVLEAGRLLLSVGQAAPGLEAPAMLGGLPGRATGGRRGGPEAGWGPPELLGLEGRFLHGSGVAAGGGRGEGVRVEGRGLETPLKSRP